MALCQDVCTPGDDSTCPVGQCCVKEGLVYLDTHEGPRPPFQISCKPFQQRGEWCYPEPDFTGMCPCASGLTCGNVQILGRCE
ncbi:uncharacterized protein LOC127838022 isoform X2 [Dreissena polymorpha]|uniref:Uncharacterized protein n=2 Tax=Dreissena polymorpha TaxID=45954 RepID=A0A9D4FGF0_DREPO|nr:uncharacterized protein LOC127838022 isoform X2 [Dreissena polymorpha]KAH3796110.1 hypothetical protein DPMN_149677 [Dreissena polymorpha]